MEPSATPIAAPQPPAKTAVPAAPALFSASHRSRRISTVARLYRAIGASSAETATPWSSSGTPHRPADVPDLGLAVRPRPGQPAVEGLRVQVGRGELGHRLLQRRLLHRERGGEQLDHRPARDSAAAAGAKEPVRPRQHPPGTEGRERGATERCGHGA
eukprot:SAG22_NODE_2028_length_3118_cov_1.428619_1_plen_157_part_10